MAPSITRHSLALTLALAVTLGGGAAAAGPAFAAGDLPPLFAEVEAGIALASFDTYGDAGLALRAALGVGAALDDLPLALYVTLSVGWVHLGDRRRTAWHTAELALDSFVYAMGLRGVAQPSERLEVLLDIQGGYRRASLSAAVDGLETYSMSEGDAVPIVGAGVRYRFLDWLHGGLRWECVFLPEMDGPDVPAQAAGFPTPRGERWQMGILATAAAHF